MNLFKKKPAPITPVISVHPTGNRLVLTSDHFDGYFSVNGRMHYLGNGDTLTVSFELTLSHT